MSSNKPTIKKAQATVGPVTRGVRAPKPPEIPSKPGKVCPNCEQEYVHAESGTTYINYPVYDSVPHENAFDCIRHLSARLKEVVEEQSELKEQHRDEIKDLRSDIESVRRGTLGEGLE